MDSVKGRRVITCNSGLTLNCSHLFTLKKGAFTIFISVFELIY